jgi:hypothetical protein
MLDARQDHVARLLDAVDQGDRRADVMQKVELCRVRLWSLSINGRQAGAASWSLREARSEAVAWLNVLRASNAA